MKNWNDILSAKSGVAVSLFLLLGFAWSPQPAQIGGGSSGGYVIQSNVPSINPVDATTYFFGGTPNVPGTAAGVHKLLIPTGGIVKRFDLFILITGTAGTAAENSTYDLRLNDTTDFCQITVDHDATVQTSTTCSQAISAGDYIEIKWVPPTWTTNPTIVVHAAAIAVQ